MFAESDDNKRAQIGLNVSQGSALHMLWGRESQARLGEILWRFVDLTPEEATDRQFLD